MRYNENVYHTEWLGQMFYFLLSFFRGKEVEMIFSS